MKKTERLLIQQNPKDALFPVRLLRITRGDLHIKKRGICCASELRDAVFAFRREFPQNSSVEVEVDAETTRDLSLTRDSEWLFNHPATYRSSL